MQKNLTRVLASAILISATSCLTPAKLDKYVASQYSDALPKQEKIRNTDVTITSSIPKDETGISTSDRKTSKVLPLLVYWQFDYRHTCNLNPALGVNSFMKSFNTHANRELNKKLAGQKLELTVEQIPGKFAIVDKAHIIFLLLYAVTWDKLYVEPDSKELIVSYKLIKDGADAKTGKIAVNNIEQNVGIRYFQSWKSATSEYLARYNQDVNTMTKIFVEKLVAEL